MQSPIENCIRRQLFLSIIFADSVIVDKHFAASKGKHVLFVQFAVTSNEIVLEHFFTAGAFALYE